MISELIHSFVLIDCIISSQSTWSPNSTIIVGTANGDLGSTLFRLSNPTSMSYDRSKRVLIVSDTSNYRIIQFALDNLSGGGTILAGGNGQGCNLSQFKWIEGAVLDSSRQLFVIDSSCYRLMKFPADSNSTINGQVISTVNQPHAIAVDYQTDDIYVSDAGNNQILKFAKNSTTGVVAAG